MSPLVEILVIGALVGVVLAMLTGGAVLLIVRMIWREVSEVFR